MVVTSGEDLVSREFSIADAKRQGGKTTYKLRTSKGDLHDDGKYFSERELTRSR